MTEFRAHCRPAASRRAVQPLLGRLRIGSYWAEQRQSGRSTWRISFTPRGPAVWPIADWRVPLSPDAIDILCGLPSANNAKPNNEVFAGDRGPLSQMSITVERRRMKLGRFTVPGMRSSFRDYMGDRTKHPESAISRRSRIRSGMRSPGRIDAKMRSIRAGSCRIGQLSFRAIRSGQAGRLRPDETSPIAEKAIEAA